MASTSARSASEELLEYCLAGDTWPDSLLREAMEENDGRALLRIVVERLGDLFDPLLCDRYATLFARVLELLRPEYSAAQLVDRYHRVRKPQACERNPEIVYVLSRVTLGADVAVTSIVLDAMKQRFPDASIRFVGPRKNFELFAADERIQLHEFNYPRASGLGARIGAAPKLWVPGSIVVDPDSRLTQLGLLPVCSEADYFFFESRSYGGDAHDSLGELTKRWVRNTFSVSHANAYIAPHSRPAAYAAGTAVSLGVGENNEKRLGDDFEEALLRMLSTRGGQIVIDEGAGGDERDRVRRLASRVPSIAIHSGAYAPFARTISEARLYVGYDSAGQHVAAATGVPLISIFSGYPSDRMFARWRPTGPGPIEVIKVERRDTAAVLERVASALQNFTS